MSLLRYLYFVFAGAILIACTSCTDSHEPEVELGPYLPVTGEILYETRRGGDRILSLTSLEGTVLVPKRYGEKFFSGHSWSPEGLKFCYTASNYNSAGSNIYVCNRADLSTEPLVTSSYLDISPSWSPTGEWIAFWSNRPTPAPGVYIVRPDGTEETLVYETASARHWLTWNPEGTFLVAAGFSKAAVIAIPSRETNELFEVYYAKCSPVADQIVAGSSGILTMPLSGTPETRLTDQGKRPFWSSDGSSVVFVSSDRTSISTVSVESGTQAHHATFAEHVINGPAWHPELDVIAFSTDLMVNGGDRQLYFIDVSENTVTRLTDGFYWAEGPSWRPALNTSRPGQAFK